MRIYSAIQCRVWFSRTREQRIEIAKRLKCLCVNNAHPYTKCVQVVSEEDSLNPNEVYLGVLSSWGYDVHAINAKFTEQELAEFVFKYNHFGGCDVPTAINCILDL